MKPNYLKQKTDYIKSILEKKSYLSFEEKKQHVLYELLKTDIPYAKTEHEMKTLGRGTPEVDGSRYFIKEKKHLQSKLPELSDKLEQIASGVNSEEKLSIIEKSCNTKNLYGLIGVIDLLSRKYSSENDKQTLKKISKYEMHNPQTVMSMIIAESGQSKRIMELSQKGLLD